MRTTIELDDDTRAAVDCLRKQEGIGVSEAVNRLLRRALEARDPRTPFTQQTRRVGIRIDVSNVADALEVLDGPSSR